MLLHSSARKQHIPTVELLLVLQITQLVMPLRREFTKLVEAKPYKAGGATKSAITRATELPTVTSDMSHQLTS